MSFIWLDGNLIPESDLKISPFDRGLCHGLSFFETILAVRGKPCLLNAHLQRLNQSLARVTHSHKELTVEFYHEVISDLLKKNDLDVRSARVRITLSMGIGPLNQLTHDRSWVLITTSPLGSAPEQIRVTTAPWKRDQQSIMCGLKTGSYAENIIALNMARNEGFHELVFYNHDDEICEAAMANLFLIRSGKLYTPPLSSGCLAGITRSFIIYLAKQNGIQCFEKPLKRNDINKAECVFLTSSLHGPVRIFSYESVFYHSHPIFEILSDRWKEAMLDSDF